MYFFCLLAARIFQRTDETKRISFSLDVNHL